jgi:hypothetical protein
MSFLKNKNRTEKRALTLTSINLLTLIITVSLIGCDMVQSQSKDKAREQSNLEAIINVVDDLLYETTSLKLKDSIVITEGGATAIITPVRDSSEIFVEILSSAVSAKTCASLEFNSVDVQHCGNGVFSYYLEDLPES